MLLVKPRDLLLTVKTRTLLWCTLAFMLVARIVSSALVPLADTTEARYGEIARKMLETGDWITPQHEYGVPFWAKPPLSTWLSAFSMKLFGVNEFAARLPSLLLGIAMLALIWQWTASRRGRDAALVNTTILASMALFFMAGGAVMTDSSLAFCTTLIMVAFWQALHSPQRFWGYLFFVGLGLGLLAKGPVVGVLTFLAIIPWVCLRKNWQQMWRSLPWLSGSALMLVIGLPWYAIAEHKTPGFIAYFILGEHFSRFLNSGWGGDKYGHAHAEVFGMIWVFWFMSAFPWSLVFLTKAKLLITRRSEWLHDDNGFISFLLLWSFTSMFFFTFANNIIWPYPLPALPAFAVLIVELMYRFGAAQKPLRARLIAFTLAVPIALLVVTAIYTDEQQTLLKSSQRATAQYYMRVRPNADSGLYYFRRRYYSGEFYSAGKAKVIDADDISTLFNNGVSDFVVIYPEDLASLAPEIRAHFKTLQQLGKFLVLQENPGS
ncbi:MAG: glycosyl transferase, family 39 [Verrucomicrobiaceae bacterium]|nr:glycosyl transferase, family 39 [Verrucomicrobiaceae bacterium]